jgi:transposase InsO family protein
MDIWAHQAGVKLNFIRPGKPVENGYIESLNGRLRDECLNVEVFLDLADAGGNSTSGEATTTNSVRTARWPIGRRTSLPVWPCNFPPPFPLGKGRRASPKRLLVLRGSSELL